MRVVKVDDLLGIENNDRLVADIKEALKKVTVYEVKL